MKLAVGFWLGACLSIPAFVELAAARPLPLPSADKRPKPHSHADGRAAIGFALLTDADVERISRQSGELCGARSDLSRGGGRELVVGVRSDGDGGRRLAAAFVLADEPGVPTEVLGDIKPQSGGGSAEGHFRPAEMLFHWEDEDRAHSSRGAAIAELTIVPLTNESASGIRQLAAELIEGRIPGLADMARRAGYYREAMALARDDEGRPYLVVYLELVDTGMRARLRALAPSAFMEWWTPRFLSLVDMRGAGSLRNVLRCTLAE